MTLVHRARVRRRVAPGVAGSSSRARSLVAASLGGALALLLGAGWRGAAAVPAGAWAGLALAGRLAERTQREARQHARDELPLVLDRVSTCVLAGMSVERALRTVAPGTGGLLGEALTEGLRALDVGVPRSQVYPRIAERAGIDELRSVMAGVARAERFGTSVADALLAHADDLRARARARAEAEARTAPIKMLFPLVLCFLPAFVLLTIAPIAMSAVRTLSGF